MSNSAKTSIQSPPLANFGWALATLLRDYQKQVEAALAGLPGGGRAFLVMLQVQSEPSQSQIAIAERIALDKTTLTYLLDGLEREGLIRRVTDPNDRRSRHINLTPEGVSAMAGFSRAVENVEQSILARLDKDEATWLKTALIRASGLDRQANDTIGNEDDAAHICRSLLAPNDAC